MKKLYANLIGIGIWFGYWFGISWTSVGTVSEPSVFEWWGVPLILLIMFIPLLIGYNIGKEVTKKTA